MSLAETRRRVLDTAATAVSGGGLAVGLDHVSFEEAIRDADVSRTAAYRCWPHKDVFLADLAVELTGRAVPVNATRSRHGTTLIREVVRAGKLRTATQRAQTLEAVVRAAAADDFAMDQAEAHRWQTYLALILALRTMPEGDLRDRVGTALAEADESLTDRIAGSHRKIIEFFGFRARTDYHTLARTALALMRGLVIGELTGRQTRSGPIDTEIAAVAFAGLLVANTEPADESIWPKATITAKLEQLTVDDFFEQPH